MRSMSKSAVIKYLSAIGSVGGSNGTGNSKRRPRAHYVKAAKLSHASRKRKKLSSQSKVGAQ